MLAEPSRRECGAHESECVVKPLDSHTLAELKDLLSDLRSASDDGRLLAQRYADILKNAVDEYCSEFDKRAEALLKRIDEAA